MASATRSASSWVRARTSTSAVAEAGTVFAVVPARTRLGVTVVPRWGAASAETARS